MIPIFNRKQFAPSLGELTVDRLEMLDMLNSPLMGNEHESEPSALDVLDAIAVFHADDLSGITKGMPWRGLSVMYCQRVLHDPKFAERETVRLCDHVKARWNPPQIAWNEGRQSQQGISYTIHMRVALAKHGMAKDYKSAGAINASDALHMMEAIYEQETGETRIRTKDHDELIEFLKASVKE